MRRLIIITDAEPTVKRFWNHWEIQDGRIENEILTVKLRSGSKLIVEAIDVDLVADIVMSHDPSSEVIKGKLGITSVKLEEVSVDVPESVSQFVGALRKLMRELEE